MRKSTKILLAATFATAAAVGGMEYYNRHKTPPPPIAAPAVSPLVPATAVMPAVSRTVQYSDFLDYVDAGDIVAVNFVGDKILTGTTPDGKILLAETTPAEVPVLVQTLREKKIRFDFIELTQEPPASAQASAQATPSSNPFSNLAFDIQIALSAGLLGVIAWQIFRPMSAASRLSVRLKSY